VTRAKAALLAAAALAMLAFCTARLELGTDVTHFMPSSSRSELARISQLLSDSPFTRTMVLSLEAEEPDVAVAAARALSERLREHPEVASVRGSLRDEQMRPLFELYFPRRHYFLSDEPEAEIPELLAEPALRARARAVRARLASPASSVFERIAAADPLGAFERIAERFRGSRPALTLRGGQLVTRDGRFAIVLLETRASAFASARQARLLADLEAAFEEIRARLGADLALESSGANRFAVAAERSMKRDIGRIAAFSFCGVAALFLAFVGSLRGFLVVSVPPLSGILVATTAGLLVFGRLDGLTMAFGASLMGIAIDYSNHLLLHHRLSPEGEPAAATARRIRPSLVLGALTTVASVAGLAITAFPAFREMSFFAAVGVVAALVVTLTVLPDLLRFVPPLPARSGRTARRLARAVPRLARAPRLLAPLLLAALAPAALALPDLRWQDDMAELTRFDPELVEESRRVRERVSRLDAGRFVIGVAPDPAAAVALNDRVHERLGSAVASGGLAGTRSLHGLLWSRELQLRNREVLTARDDLFQRVEAAFVQEGFRPGALRPFEEALREAPPPPLALADLEASPLADFLAPFVFPLGEETAVVTYLRGVESTDAVREVLSGLPGVHLLDQRTFVNEVYREFRETTLRQMVVGGALVLAILALRYRRGRAVVASLLPSVAVVVLLLGAFARLGVEVNLLHVMSLVMVTGMGVDYGVFLVDSARRREDLGATMMSLLLSCLTTVFVFGTLAISSQPALRAIGVTTGAGILLSYLLAPVALVAAGLAGRERRPA